MKIYHPKNTLRDALVAAEPMLAQTALGRAETGLRSIRAECLAHLDELMKDLDPAPQGGGDTASRVRHAYERARRIIGLGAVTDYPQLDLAARSLCDVADGILSRPQPDWAPIRAHIDAMLLMRLHPLPPEATRELLASLDKLRARFGFASAP
jgi:hypothetical protein